MARKKEVSEPLEASTGLNSIKVKRDALIEGLKPLLLTKAQLKQGGGNIRSKYEREKSYEANIKEINELGRLLGEGNVTLGSLREGVMEIIIKGGGAHRPQPRSLEGMSKDELHYRRKALESDLKNTIFSKDKMDQRDCVDKDHEEKRVRDYDAWKKTKDSRGLTNEQKMTQWSEINRVFKKRGLEGKQHTLDEIRKAKSVKYD